MKKIIPWKAAVLAVFLAGIIRAEGGKTPADPPREVLEQLSLFKYYDIYREDIPLEDNDLIDEALAKPDAPAGGKK